MLNIATLTDAELVKAGEDLLNVAKQRILKGAANEAVVLIGKARGLLGTLDADATRALNALESRARALAGAGVTSAPAAGSASSSSSSSSSTSPAG